MSGQATGWVLRHGPHPGHIDRYGRRYGRRARGWKSVLTAVADSANPDGENAHPGLESLCRGSLYSRSHVIAVLAELEEEGWLKVTANPKGGRGLAKVFSIIMTPRHGPVSEPIASPSRAETVASRVDPLEPKNSPETGPFPPSNGAGTGPFKPETVQSGALNGPVRVDPYVVPTTNNPILSAKTADDPPVFASMTIELCDQLAEAIGSRPKLRKPKVTARWHRDMDLLLRRGPLGVEPGPVSPQRVRNRIVWLFAGPGAERSSSGFCWTDQVRSPLALRKHWEQITVAHQAHQSTALGRVGESTPMDKSWMKQTDLALLGGTG